MRVLHVSPTAFGRDGLFGGGERYPVELAKALAVLDGVQCELLTFGRVARVEQANGLRIRVLRARTHLRHHPAHPVATGLLGATRGVDVVHVHHLRSAPSRLCAVVAAARRTPIAVTDHGLAGGDWMGVLPRLIDRFLTVSQYSSDVLGSPTDKTTVIYGGADPRRFFPDPGTRNGVLFVGRMTPHKGVDRLIEALPDGVRLTIAGTGGHDPDQPERDYPEHLRRLADGKDVRFLGAVPDRELPELYRRASVLAVPSVHRTCYGRDVAVSELLGLTTLEAMASATPVVASRVGGLREVIDDGVTGYLVAPGDIEQLRGRLRLLLDDAALARRLGAAARDRVMERFTWHACAQRCRDVYRSMVS
jgi:glycosyltransferase involved in cell wall biosynthesis